MPTHQLQLSLPLDSLAVAPSTRSNIITDLLVATWNVNSIRARLDLVIRWLEKQKPDIVFLQETKVTDDLFPTGTLRGLGYQAVCFGQPQYNGVAILSRTPITEQTFGLDPSQDREARLIAATILGIRVLTVYVPNAVSTSDARFAQKVRWLETLAVYVGKEQERYPKLLLCGDFNVVPFDFDAHDISYWLYRTFVHSDVRGALSRVTNDRLTDLHIYKNGRVRSFTWWDYRNQAFSLNNGIRIDHFYATNNLAQCCKDVWVDVGMRREKLASDHAPVLARFALVASDPAQ